MQGRQASKGYSGEKKTTILSTRMIVLMLTASFIILVLGFLFTESFVDKPSIRLQESIFNGFGNFHCPIKIMQLFQPHIFLDNGSTPYRFYFLHIEDPGLKIIDGRLASISPDSKRMLNAGS